MRTSTGEVKEFESDEAAKAAGYTLTVTPNAAAALGRLSVADRAQVATRLALLEQDGAKVVDENDVRAALTSRKQWRAYRSERKRVLRRATG